MVNQKEFWKAFFFERVGLMVGRGGKKARLITVKRRLTLFF